VAAQEFLIEVLGPAELNHPQPVRGTVHDENAWALYVVSGHAGLFSTVLLQAFVAIERSIVENTTGAHSVKVFTSVLIQLSRKINDDNRKR
jgi:hypothetical protein